MPARGTLRKPFTLSRWAASFVIQLSSQLQVMMISTPKYSLTTYTVHVKSKSQVTGWHRERWDDLTMERGLFTNLNMSRYWAKTSLLDCLDWSLQFVALLSRVFWTFPPPLFHRHHIWNKILWLSLYHMVNIENFLSFLRIHQCLKVTWLYDHQLLRHQVKICQRNIT